MNSIYQIYDKNETKENLVDLFYIFVKEILNERFTQCYSMVNAT